MSRLSGVTMNGFARQVITLACRAGLDPHLGPDGAAPDAHGRVSIMIRSDNARDGLFGVIYLSAHSGAHRHPFLGRGHETPLTADKDLGTHWAQPAAQRRLRPHTSA